MKNDRDVLPVPRELTAARFAVDGDEYALLSFVCERHQAHDPEPVLALTTAEQAVLHLLRDGLSNQEIARIRRTSVRTVGNQVGVIYKKIGASGRRQILST
jgi:DNA-binding NarL/FixJ family response regulator